MKEREVLRDDEKSRDLVSMTTSQRNPTSRGRQPSDTYKSYDYASRDTAHGPTVDSEKMRLDWSRWYIAVHSAFPYPRESGISCAIARKFTFVAVCSYIYLCRIERAYINYNIFDKCVDFDQSIHDAISDIIYRRTVR